MALKLSKIISLLLHPVLMPMLGLFFIFNSGTYLSLINPDVKLFLYAIVGLSTVAMPIIILPLLLYAKVIKGIEMTLAQERIIPLFFTGIFYFIAYYYISRYPVLLFIKLFLVSGIINIILAMIISFKWKISIHSIGLGGILGLLIYISLFFSINLNTFLIIALNLWGLVAFARLKLNAHNPLQVYIGFLTGFAIVFSTLLTY